MNDYKITKEDAKLTPFKADVVKYLTDDDMIEFYLNYILEEGDEVDLKMALGHIAKAKGMTAVAQEIGVNRENLYKSLNGQTKTQFDTIYKLLKSFGLTLRVAKA
jgi:probable addiction module antidote protein